MNEFNEDRLESIDLEPSRHSERTLIQLGALLYNSLIAAERLSEVELLMDAIGEYATMASFYGDKTGRTPESLGVDLNEAALFKHDSLKRDESNEWQTYANQFKNTLKELASELGVDLPLLN
jgi:hypothetical protein